MPDSAACPRGADLTAAEMPSMGYSLNTRAEAWAENMGTLYEETRGSSAVARQWSSTRDIPWHTLQPLPKDIEHAMCQLCTFFTEVEFIAGDVPGWWLSQINAAYHETKLFMATQIMDEARHLEVFASAPWQMGVAWASVLQRSRRGSSISLTFRAHSPRC